MGTPGQKPKNAKVTEAANRYPRSGNALPPFFRIARRVENAVDSHHIVKVLVVDGIREPSNQGAAVILMDQSVHFRRSRQRFDTRVDAAQILLTQADPLVFVPSVGLLEIPLRLRRDHQLSGHSDCESGV